VADIESVIGYIEALEESNSKQPDSKVRDQIINSSLDKPVPVRPTLTSAERSRLKNKMDIIVESFYRLRKKYETDEKGKTAVADTTKKAAAASTQDAETESKTAKKGIFGLLGKIFSLLAFFGKPLLRFLSKRLTGLLKALGNTLKKGLGFLKKIVGKLLGGLKRLLSRGIRAIGGFFRNIFKGFRNSAVFKGFVSALQKGKDLAKGIFNAAKNKIVGALKAVGRFFGNALSKIPGIGKLFPALAKTTAATAAGASARAGAQAVTQPRPAPAKKGFFGRLISKGADVVGGGFKAVKSGVGAAFDAGKTVVSKGVQGVKAVGSAVGTGLAKAGSAAFRLTGKPLQMAFEGVKNWFKTSGKKLFGGVLRKIPLIGSIIEGVFATYDIRKFAKDPAGSMADLEQQIGKRVIEGMGGVALGTAVGAALTPVLGPLGTFLGFLGGDIVGRKIGGIVSDVFGARPFGKMVLKAFPNLVPEEARATMQDFIVQKGTVMPFSSQDEVMGMKPGGAISQFLRDTGMSREIANLQKTTNSYLAQLVQLTRVLVQKPAGGGGKVPNVPLPRNNELQGDLSGPTFSDNRADFANSTYHMA